MWGNGCVLEISCDAAAKQASVESVAFFFSSSWLFMLLFFLFLLIIHASFFLCLLIHLLFFFFSLSWIFFLFSFFWVRYAEKKALLTDKCANSKNWAIDGREHAIFRDGCDAAATRADLRCMRRRSARSFVRITRAPIPAERGRLYIDQEKGVLAGLISFAGCACADTYNLCVCVYVYACMCVLASVCVYVYACMCACECVCIYKCGCWVT